MNYIKASQFQVGRLYTRLNDDDSMYVPLSIKKDCGRFYVTFLFSFKNYAEILNFDYTDNETIILIDAEEP